MKALLLKICIFSVFVMHTSCAVICRELWSLVDGPPANPSEKARREQQCAKVEQTWEDYLRGPVLNTILTPVGAISPRTAEWLRIELGIAQYEYITFINETHIMIIIVTGMGRRTEWVPGIFVGREAPRVENIQIRADRALSDFISPNNLNNPSLNFVEFGGGWSDSPRTVIIGYQREERFAFNLGEADADFFEAVLILEDHLIPDDIAPIVGDEFAGGQLAAAPLHGAIIEAGAFRNGQLEYVVIPYGTVSIGYWAFAGNRIASATLPGSVVYIENGAFSRNRLTSVDIPYGVTSIGSWAFGQNLLGDVTLPASVAYIGNYAFINNQLASVAILGSVASIGSWAFAINQLSSIAIPDSVSSIGESAFAVNPLANITIGENVAIGDNAFGSGFEEFYEGNGRKAGTYTLYNGNWVFQPR